MALWNATLLLKFRCSHFSKIFRSFKILFIIIIILNNPLNILVAFLFHLTKWIAYSFKCIHMLVLATWIFDCYGNFFFFLYFYFIPYSLFLLILLLLISFHQLFIPKTLTFLYLLCCVFWNLKITCIDFEVAPYVTLRHNIMSEFSIYNKFTFYVWLNTSSCCILSCESKRSVFFLIIKKILYLLSFYLYLFLNQI